MDEEETTPNDLWSNIKSVTLDAAKQEMVQRKHHNVPWITDDTLDLVNHRKQVKKTGLLTQEQRSTYQNLNREIQRAMRSDKRKNNER